jgi:hypothetical protein
MPVDVERTFTVAVDEECPAATDGNFELLERAAAIRVRHTTAATTIADRLWLSFAGIG